MTLHVGIDATSLLVPRPRGEGKTLLRLYQEIARLQPEWRFTFFGQTASPSALAIRDTIPNSRIVLFDLPGFRWNTWENIGLPFRAWRQRVDVLHCTSSGTPIWSPVPVVMTVHDLIPLLFDDGAGDAGRDLFRRRISAGVRISRRILCVSENTRQDLLRLYPVARDRATAVPWAVDPVPDPAATPLPEFDGRKIVLSMGGGGARRKNVATMIEAIARVSAAAGPVLLVVLGVSDPAERRSLQELAHTRDAADRVLLEEYVSESRLEAYFASAACSLYLSTYEGFGLPPLEAMRHGVPVIASNRSSIPEVVGDAGILVDPQDVAAVTAALDRLLCDPALAREKRAASLARVAHFSWRTTAERTVEALRAT
ncbi:MAG: glycosyltransferase family 4 protein [Burkholderiales bacterium]|nr:glycosyltransferase family 4 protein [Burkholderiales bacterium]